MKQKLYALDAFFIEKLKLSENYPQTQISLESPVRYHSKLFEMSELYSLAEKFPRKQSMR